LCHIIFEKASGTVPVLVTNNTLGQPCLLCFVPLSLILLVSERFFASGAADVYLVKVFKMVSIVVFPRKGILRSWAIAIVAKEFIFLVGVHILIVTFEISWSTEDILLSVAWSRVLARELVLLVIPVRE
jgi:hypothetical protein